MTKALNVAVLGATGLVGETIINLLHERQFPVDTLFPLASNRSLGKTVDFGGKAIDVIDADSFDYRQAAIGLFSAGGSVSRVHAPRAAEAGCVVIDNTSEFRYDADVPLVVPEVNPEAIDEYRNRGIIANPNCSTIQMLVALKPLHDVVPIRRLSIATYQAVSGAGRNNVEKLAKQTADLLNARPLELDDAEKQIAFNALPHIDTFEDNGYTREEMKMVWETRKILAVDELAVSATCVRIPSFFGHSEAVQIEFEDALSAEQARQILAAAPGIEVLDEHRLGGYPTAVTEASGNDPVYVGRIRDDISLQHGLCLWIVADNVRKGAALNSVQIAEILVKNLL
ncbi:MAG: aspartate-semialdehyde dehydrogenase [Pseudomonadota bacterium]